MPDDSDSPSASLLLLTFFDMGELSGGLFVTFSFLAILMAEFFGITFLGATSTVSTPVETPDKARCTLWINEGRSFAYTELFPT